MRGRLFIGGYLQEHGWSSMWQRGSILNRAVVIPVMIERLRQRALRELVCAKAHFTAIECHAY